MDTSSKSPSQYEEERVPLNPVPAVHPRTKMQNKNFEDKIKFSAAGSWDKFKVVLHKRNILEEKKLSLNELNDNYPHIFDNITKWEWEFYTEPQGDYNEVVMREFYTASFTRSKQGTVLTCRRSKLEGLMYLVVL